MTHHYLAGELSLILGELEGAATGQSGAIGVARLRQQAETRPPKALATVAQLALALANDLCWDSLIHGDTATFTREVELSAELHRFGVCAGLLGDDYPSTRGSS
jgi:hypothetical protein